MTPRSKPGSTADSSAAEKISAEAPPPAHPESIDNIARFFGRQSGHGRPGSLVRPIMNNAPAAPQVEMKKGQRVRHAKYGEGTVLIREGEGEDAKLTVMFTRHGMKKLMEKFANLQKI
jgi:DNA helicase-2/ATP-dependent DNA helicase PcrA